MTSDDRQRIVDDEHLRLLSLFHYISGSLTVAIAAMFGFMLGMMSLMFSIMPPQIAAPCPDADPCSGVQTPPAPFPEALFLGFFGVFFAVLMVLGVLEIISGRYIAKRRRRLFSIIVSIPRILAFPYGTLLSIFTLLVLERSTVKRLYTPDAT